jgi:hypothetical protein
LNGLLRNAAPPPKDAIVGCVRLDGRIGPGAGVPAPGREIVAFASGTADAPLPCREKDDML